MPARTASRLASHLDLLRVTFDREEPVGSDDSSALRQLSCALRALADGPGSGLDDAQSALLALAERIDARIRASPAAWTAVAMMPTAPGARRRKRLAGILRRAGAALAAVAFPSAPSVATVAAAAAAAAAAAPAAPFADDASVAATLSSLSSLSSLAAAASAHGEQPILASFSEVFSRFAAASDAAPCVQPMQVESVQASAAANPAEEEDDDQNISPGGTTAEQRMRAESVRQRAEERAASRRPLNESASGRRQASVSPPPRPDKVGRTTYETGGPAASARLLPR